MLTGIGVRASNRNQLFVQTDRVSPHATIQRRGGTEQHLAMMLCDCRSEDKPAHIGGVTRSDIAIVFIKGTVIRTGLPPTSKIRVLIGSRRTTNTLDRSGRHNTQRRQLKP